MNLWLEAFIVLLLVTALASLALAVFAARRPSVPGAVYLAILMAGAAVWCAAYAGELAATTVAGKVVWARLQYVGIVVVAPSWLLFCLAQLGVLRRRLWPALYAIPALTLALAGLAPSVPLVWQDVRLESSGGMVALVVDHGPWFWVHSLYAYAVLALGSIALVRGVLRRSRALTLQAATVILAALLPWAANVLSLTGVAPRGVDFTAPVFALSVALVCVALLRFDLLDLSPSTVVTAHDTLLDEMHDGVIVTDAQGRILSANPAARRQFAAQGGRLEGRSLDTVLALWELGGGDPVERRLDAAAGRSGEVAFRVVPRESVDGGRETVLDGVVSRLGTQKRPRGYVLAVRDVTEREATLRTLGESEDRLRVLFDRSPVAVLVFDAQLAITECNDRMVEVLGLTRDELVGAQLPAANAPPPVPALPARPAGRDRQL